MGAPHVVKLATARRDWIARRVSRGSLLTAAYVSCLSVFAGVLVWGLIQWSLGIVYGDATGLDRFAPRVLTLSYPIGVFLVTTVFAMVLWCCTGGSVR
jgi:hypothetical protein